MESTRPFISGGPGYESYTTRIGRIDFPNGDVYEGEQLLGKPDGTGTMRYHIGPDENRLEYTGKFFNGCFKGRGTLTFQNGDRYEGEFLNNQFHGKGIMRYHNGDCYEGEFRLNTWNGMGKFSRANGEFYDGYFSNGKFSSGHQDNIHPVTTFDRDGMTNVTLPGHIYYSGRRPDDSGHCVGKLTYPGEFGYTSYELASSLYSLPHQKKKEYSGHCRYDRETRHLIPHGEGTLTYHPSSNRLKFQGIFENGGIKNGVLTYNPSYRYQHLVRYVGPFSEEGAPSGTGGVLTYVDGKEERLGTPGISYREYPQEPPVTGLDIVTGVASGVFGLLGFLSDAYSQVQAHKRK